MPSKSEQKTVQIGQLNRLPLVLLAAAIFLISWLWIKPTLVFFGQGLVICTGIYTPWKNIFAQTPFYPGLCIDWIASVLSYIFFHFNIAATAIITALAIALYSIAGKIVKSFGEKNLKLLISIPAALLMIQYARYYHWIAEPISILLAATAFCYYNRIKLPPKTRLILFFVSTILIYIIIPKGLLVFALLCIMTELTGKSFFNSLMLLLLAGLSPWLCNLLIFKTDLIETYQRLAIFHPGQGTACNVISNLSIVYWPIAIVLCKITKPTKISTSKFMKILSPALPAILVIIAVFASADYAIRNKKLIDYYSYNHNWNKVLTQAKRISEKNYDILTCHDVNRALYHKGQLSSNMFDYPQHYESLLLNNGSDLIGGILWLIYPKLGRIYYELSDINQAEHYTSEAVELLSYYPQGLKQLALINIVKQQYNTAKVYLNALSKDPLYRKWAKKYLDKLNDPQLFKLDKNIMKKRDLWAGKDQDMTNRYASQDLFASNNENKMAFEYMMAFCLLTGQHAPVANSIKYLDKLDYPEGVIPKLYEQAILLYTQMTNQKADLATRKISNESLTTFQQFSQKTSTTSNMTMEQASKSLANDFKNTYYYYYHFLRPKK